MDCAWIPKIVCNNACSGKFECVCVCVCVCLGGSLAASYKMLSYHLNNEDFPSPAGQALAMWVFRELCAARRVYFALWMYLVNPACMNTQLLCGCYRIKNGLGSALCFLTLVNVYPEPGLQMYVQTELQ